MNDLPSKHDLEARGETHGFRLSGRQLGGGLIAVALVVFILSNRDPISVQFLFIEWRTTQWLVLAITALLGAAVGAFGFARRQRRRGRRS